jgi:uracil-DNA glycosylase family 4
MTDQAYDPAAAMDVLYEEYAATPVLAELAAGRRLVRGHGPLDSPFMVVGEAPGADEERRGRPFTGPSGQLLQELFKRAGIRWDLCYATNTVPWRPPGNRTPYPFQVQASHDRIWQEILVVNPVVVVTAGYVAWRGVTRGRLGSFEEARFKWHELSGRRILAIPHPAFILRLPDRDQAQWEQQTVDALSQALVA